MKCPRSILVEQWICKTGRPPIALGIHRKIQTHAKAPRIIRPWVIHHWSIDANTAKSIAPMRHWYPWKSRLLECVGGCGIEWFYVTPTPKNQFRHLPIKLDPLIMNMTIFFGFGASGSCTGSIWSLHFWILRLACKIQKSKLHLQFYRLQESQIPKRGPFSWPASNSEFRCQNSKNDFFNKAWPKTARWCPPTSLNAFPGGF